EGGSSASTDNNSTDAATDANDKPNSTSSSDETDGGSSDEATSTDSSDEAGADDQQAEGDDTSLIDGGSTADPISAEDEPPGGVCLEPAEIRLDDWEDECVTPTPVDVACEMTATATGPNGTNVGTFGLNQRGHAVIAPIQPPVVTQALVGGTTVTLLSDDLEPVLTEMVTPEGCVERRAETFFTATGSLQVQTSAAGSSCQVTESSDEVLRRYASSRMCTCDEQNVEFEQQFGADGELL